jgi:hypothetical protein
MDSLGIARARPVISLYICRMGGLQPSYYPIGYPIPCALDNERVFLTAFGTTFVRVIPAVMIVITTHVDFDAPISIFAAKLIFCHKTGTI